LGTTAFKALKPGEPFLFKLKKEHDNAIVGFGVFAAFVQLTVQEAWDVFRQENGVPSLASMWERVTYYVRRNKGETPRPTHEIGCVLLSSPVFFPKELWVPGPADWQPPTVVGKGYDLSHGEGKRIWEDCLRACESLSLSKAAQHNLGVLRKEAHYGVEVSVRPRLGSGSFRYVVREAYGRCAVTDERSLPALDAAHIKPHAVGGPHDVSNGLLLRADIHRLYERGYVTVTPDLTFKVSGRLRELYDGGHVYYDLDGKRIWTPDPFIDQPNPDFLAYHGTDVFVD
jgi:putative restriction endonuclease